MESVARKLLALLSRGVWGNNVLCRDEKLGNDSPEAELEM